MRAAPVPSPPTACPRRKLVQRGGLLLITVLAGLPAFAACGEPIDFNADGLRSESDPSRLVLEGSARVSRCDEVISAPVIVAYVRDDDTLYRVDIPADARLDRGDQRLTADWAVVDFEEGLATLGGSVRFDSPALRIACDRLEVDLDREEVFCQRIGTRVSARLRPDQLSEPSIK